MGVSSIPVAGSALDHLLFGFREDIKNREIVAQFERLVRRIEGLERGELSIHTLIERALGTSEAIRFGTLIEALNDQDFIGTCERMAAPSSALGDTTGEGDPGGIAFFAFNPITFLRNIDETEAALKRSIEDLRKRMVLQVGKTFDHRSCAILLHIARSISQEAHLGDLCRKNGTARIWFADTDVVVDLVQASDRNRDPNENACFAKYFWREPPLVPTRVLPGQLEEVMAFLQQLTTRAQRNLESGPLAVASYDQFTELVRSGRLALGGQMAPPPTELLERFAHAFWLDMRNETRVGSRSDARYHREHRLITSLATLTHANALREPSEPWCIYLTSSSKLAERDGKRNLIQHIYGAAWHSHTAEYSSELDETVIALAAKAVEALPSHLARIEAAQRAGSTGQPDLQSAATEEILKIFQERLLGFHDEVARHAEAELVRECRQYREWIAAVADGRARIVDLARQLEKRSARTGWDAISQGDGHNG